MQIPFNKLRTRIKAVHTRGAFKFKCVTARISVLHYDVMFLKYLASKLSVFTSFVTFPRSLSQNRMNSELPLVWYNSNVKHYENRVF